MTQNDDKHRVVVTGLGAVTPYGDGVPALWQNIIAGNSCADFISKFDASAYGVKIGCEIKNFDPQPYAEFIDHKEARRLDPFEMYTVACTAQAIKQANLKIDDSNAEDIGALIGTGIGGLVTMEQGVRTLLEKGPMRVSPLTGTYMIPNMGAGHVAITFGAKGPNFSLNSACATGNHALGEAFEVIRRGDALAMVTGGCESAVTSFGLAAFHRSGAMSTRNDDPKRASRPFDAQRDGFVFSEGAGVMILERLDFARQRNAKILAEMVGYGATNDAFHVSAPAPHGTGAARSMKRALQKAGLAPEQIDYINAHGTSTVLNDAAETEAIKTVFGEYAYAVPVSSTKSMVGHMLGAAGAVEGVVSIMTILNGVIHPTINYENPDPICDLDYVPNTARKKEVKTVMSNSFGFGGHNATVIFKKYED